MKTLKIMLCAMFVLCGSLVFAACGEKPKNFDVNLITVSNENVFTYDGTSHAVGVSYKGVNAKVSYALENDRNNFKSLKDLNTVNAAEYKLYYRLTADGYNTYTSSKPIEMTVEPRVLEIVIEDQNIMLSDNKQTVDFTKSSIVGLAECDKEADLGIYYEFGNDFNLSQVQYDEEYDITCHVSNPNYIVSPVQAKLYIRDYVQIKDSNGDSKGYYKNLNEALEEAQPGETIVLHNNITTKKSFDINKSITIDGQNRYQVVAMADFKKGSYANLELASIFTVAKADVTLTLKDVIIDGSQKARAVSAFAGKVVINGARITNGKKTDKWRSGGVFITNAASFEMTSGKIVNNDANDETYTKWCADLWIGANVQGSLISVTGGEIGSVFVNSNSYSATGAGKFVMGTDSAEANVVLPKIKNIFVEYDSGYGAMFDYKKGEISHLMIALKNDNLNADNRVSYGVYEEVTPVENTLYTGGTIVNEEVRTSTVETYKNRTFGEEIDELLTDGRSYIFEGCTFEFGLSSTRNIELVFNNCTFLNGSTPKTVLYLTTVSRLVVNNCTFEGNTTGGYAIDVNLYSVDCSNITITNNIFSTTSIGKDVAISIKTRLGETDHPTESWIAGAGQGKIVGEVFISGNKFTASNNTIYIGEKPQGSDTTENSTTGDFDIVISGNLGSLNIVEMYKVNDEFNEESSRALKTIQDNGLYDSKAE